MPAAAKKPTQDPSVKIEVDDLQNLALYDFIIKKATEAKNALAKTIKPSLTDYYFEEAAKVTAYADLPKTVVVEEHATTAKAQLKRQASAKALSPTGIKLLTEHAIPLAITSPAAWAINKKLENAAEAMALLRTIVDQHFVANPESTLPRDLLVREAATTGMAENGMLHVLQIKDAAKRDIVFNEVGEIALLDLKVSNDDAIKTFLSGFSGVLFPDDVKPEPDPVVAAPEPVGSNVTKFEAPKARVAEVPAVAETMPAKTPAKRKRAAAA